MAPSRIQAAWEARSLQRTARRAAQREDDALVRAGEQVFEAVQSRSATPQSGEPRERVELVRAIDERLAVQQARLNASLDVDRNDYQHAGPFARWAVIGRGVLERVALRDRLRRERIARICALSALGRLAVDGPEPSLRPLVPEATTGSVQEPRIEARKALTERDALLAPWAGEPLPPWLRVIARESREFGLHVRKELLSKILLKAPAVAGLFAGWWLGRMFTDSAFEGFLHDLGLGGRRAISAETMKFLSFWVPLLAAALCGYAGTFVAKRIQQRYSQPPGSGAAQG